MVKALQAMNQEKTVAIWAERISAYRNSELSITQWCKENEICIQTYYLWQKKLFNMAQAQRESRFAEVTPIRTSGNIAWPPDRPNQGAVLVRIRLCTAVQTPVQRTFSVAKVAELRKLPLAYGGSAHRAEDRHPQRNAKGFVLIKKSKLSPEISYFTVLYRRFMV